jgi:cytochrome c-type biogenesis protein CcmH/NrfG/MinD-like ATPase involved in chromosome partitioning or flagellar assembly
MPFPYVFTFYSYKGGVGRSLAVMNVAYTLAGWGRHVLMVDMDLEAPGISGFLQRSNELAEPESAHPKDILTLLGEAARALRNGGVPDEMACSLPPVSNYIRPVAEEKLAALRPQLGLLGRLDVLGTDVSRDYNARLAQLALQDLPQDRLIALSRLLHQYLKAQVFPYRPLGIENFEPPVQTPYDYVLVDSRTGITEIGGLCVGPLADRLVVITGLNDQNVSGTLSFLEETGIQPKSRSEKDPPWDDADTVSVRVADSPSLGPKPTIVVASPVPAGEIAYKRRRLSELENLLGIRPVSLSYHPQMALMESVFVRDYPEEYLAQEYKGLATRLMAQVSDDPQRLAFEAGVLWNEKKDPVKAIACALRLASHVPELGASLLGLFSQRSPESGIPEMRQLHAVLSQNPTTRLAALNNWGNALYAMAKTKAGEEADRLFAEAGGKYAEALRLKPDYLEALNNWGAALSDQAKTKAGGQSDRLFAEAGSKYAEALRLKPDYHAALYNWGAALSDHATTKVGKEADRLFAEAGGKFAEALRLKPDLHEALFNWGNALSAQAKTKAGAEADRLFAEAGGKYAEALRLKPDYLEALNNWGAALDDQATTKAGEEADRLFAEAGSKYAEALRQKPDDHDVLYNWGNALSRQAMTKVGVEADRLFAEAGGKYAEALRLKPDFREALKNWGNALSAQAKTKVGEEADRLFAEAGGKYAEALRLKPAFHQALNNWGNALSDQAEMKAGEEADRLFTLAGTKYEAALAIRPDSYQALYNWGSALLEQARRKSGEEADRLLVQAGAVLRRVAQIKPDELYGLACLASLQIKPEECRELLFRCLTAGTLPDVAHLATDADLAAVRDLGWFQDVLREARSRQSAGSTDASHRLPKE